MGWIRLRIETAVGEKRAVDEAKDIASLAEGVLCFDVDFTLAVVILGGVKPTSSWQGGRLAGSAADGRKGSATGPTAFEDTERALRVLSEILTSVACGVFGASTPVMEQFGLVDLLAAARATTQGSMKEVFTDAFRM
eukprot:703675-Prymnesium_polylepis.1